MIIIFILAFFLALALVIYANSKKNPIVSEKSNAETSKSDDLDKQNKQRAYAALEESARWIISEGIFRLKNYGKENIDDELLDRWAVQLWIEPIVNNLGFIANFRLKRYLIRYEIHCIARDYGDSMLEYWLIKRTWEERHGEKDSSSFLITKTNDEDSIREVIYESDSFFESYRSESDEMVSVPLDNGRLIYYMEPYRFPENYKGSKLEGKRAEIVNKEYVVIK